MGGWTRVMTKNRLYVFCWFVSNFHNHIYSLGDRIENPFRSVRQAIPLVAVVSDLESGHEKKRGKMINFKIGRYRTVRTRPSTYILESPRFY